MEGVHDVVVRYMRFRPGHTGSADWSKHAFGIYGGSAATAVTHVILDHVSLYWGPDENLMAWDHVRDVAVQWSISEGMEHDLPDSTRDGTDARAVADVQNGTGVIKKATQQEPSWWPSVAAGTAPPDQDKDGMPDSWESAHGLNPTLPEDRSLDADNDGYTNLEEHLNGESPAMMNGGSGGGPAPMGGMGGMVGGNGSGGPKGTMGGSDDAADDPDAGSTGKAGGCSCNLSHGNSAAGAQFAHRLHPQAQTRRAESPPTRSSAVLRATKTSRGWAI